MKKALFLLLLIQHFTSELRAQTPEAPYISWEEFVQEYVESRENEEEETYVEEMAWMEEMALHPIQLNLASRKDLTELPFIDEAQADSILSYRKRKRGFTSAGELMFVRGVDYFTRRYLSLFVRCDSAARPDKARPLSYKHDLTTAQKFYMGTHEIETRLDVPLYKREGYKEQDKPTTSNYYAGNSLRHVVRYRYTYEKEVAYGLTAEKDPGEPVAKQGFYPYDYLSGYVMWRPKDKTWSFVLGDYEIRSGRGLLFGNDFFAGREQTLRTLRPPTSLFRPHTSTDEADYLRGGAFAWQRKAWDAMAFVSYRKIDGRDETGTDTVRTILKTGLHRTLNEIDRRRNVGNVTGGVHLGYTHRLFNLGLNAYATHYDHPVYPEKRFYNTYYFRGQTAGGASLTYGFSHKRLSIQGETAMDHKFHAATENVLVYGISAKLRLNLQCRHFSPRFISTYGNAVQQGSRVANEQGALAGLRYLPSSRWELTAYADFFRFMKPTYTSVLPNAKGMEMSLQSLTSLNNGWKILVRYRLKSQQRTITGYEQMEYRTVQRARLELRHGKQKWDWSARFDLSFAGRQTGQKSFGWMCAIRSGWKPSKRFNVKGLAALFFTDDYETALYAYEPQLLRAFAVTPYAYHGWRAVAVVNYGVVKNLTFSVRAGVTNYFNRDVISSGLDEINSSWKSDLSLQLRWVLPTRATRH